GVRWRREEGREGDAVEGLREDLGDPATLRQVVATFLDRMPHVLTELRDAATRGDQAAILAGAHGLKGTSAMLGATALSAQCAELEREARVGKLRDVPARLDVITAHAETASRALRHEIADS